jgi:pimeloyl-ACP methyl ester carboxylesterase
MIKSLLHKTLMILTLTAVSAAGAQTNGGAMQNNNRIVPFQINITELDLADLKQRLAMTRYPDQIPDSAWDYGTDTAWLRELVAYWQSDFDWREQERQLNRFDQFLTRIDGVDIHFIHQRSPHPNATPLLITHGWPGSFVEFRNLIGPLTNPELYGGNAEDAFHVIVPSLPGFGFSGKPEERGYSPERIAHTLAALMERLGYQKYGAQGGDWGAIINRILASRYSERLIGLHSNFVLANPPADSAIAAAVPAQELARREARQAYMANEIAYQQIQGTKPQTLGVGLNDSPAGLAAWITEKFHGWSDMDSGVAGRPESRISKDDMLTNISIYWFTQSITSSSRIYFENRNAAAAEPIGFIAVPTAGAIFPAEIYLTPRLWAEAHYNIVRWTEMPSGGHFAALEEPELLLQDIREFFRDL